MDKKNHIYSSTDCYQKIEGEALKDFLKHPLYVRLKARRAGMTFTNSYLTRNIVKQLPHSAYSEKNIERYLVARVYDLGGHALKYTNPYETGYPDRLVLLPEGKLFWVELKSHGQKPRKLQEKRMAELRELGQRVYTADSKEDVDEILDKETKC